MEASEQPNLAPDQATILATPDRSDAVALIGYVGQASLDEYVRLYRDLTFNEWLEFRAADVVDRAAADGGEDVTAGESIIWVQPDAEIVSGASGRLSGSGGLGPGGDEQYRYPRG